MNEATGAEAEAGWLTAIFEVSVLGVELWRVVVALALVAGAILFRRKLAAWARRGIEYAAERTENDLDDRVGRAIEMPLRVFCIAVAAFVAVQILPFEGVGRSLAEAVPATLFAFAGFRALLRLTPILGELMRKWTRVMTTELADWLERIVRATIWLLAVATVLEIWGVRVAPIIAGFGLVGVAVALGAQDLFKNLISGALILTEKRFRVGDWIKIDGVVEGTVEAISLRSTKVRRFDKAPVYIPNTELADGAVTNYGEMTHRRIFWRVGLEYRSSAAQLRAVRDRVEAYIREDGRFLLPPDGTLLVRIDQFADSSIDLLIYCFTKTRDWADWLKIKEELLLAVKEAVEEAGTGIAFPSRSLYVESGAEALMINPPKAVEAKPAARAGAKRSTKATASKAKAQSGGGRQSAAKSEDQSPAAAAAGATSQARRRPMDARGPEDGPTDGLVDAPADEGAGPTTGPAE